MILTNGTISVNLPDDLEWVDEFEYEAVSQDVQPLIGGGMVIQESTLLAGRPITLSGGSGVWALKSELLKVKDLQNIPDVSMTLTLPDARVFTVMFRRSEPPTFTARPVHRQTVTTGDTMFENITLKLMEVPDNGNNT